jgi:uncharacterized protein YndB with AHSA1/START domain
MQLTKDFGVTIDRPIGEVFDFVLDHFGEMSDFGELESITPGALRVGSRFRQVGDERWGERDPAGIIEIDRVEPPRLLAYSWNMDVPTRIETKKGFSTLLNTFPMLGWGSDGSIQVHLLEMGETQTRMVVLGTTRLSRWTVPASILGRWYIVTHANRHLRRLKARVEGQGKSQHLRV